MVRPGDHSCERGGHRFPVSEEPEETLALDNDLPSTINYRSMNTCHPPCLHTLPSSCSPTFQLHKLSD